MSSFFTVIMFISSSSFQEKHVSMYFLSFRNHTFVNFCLHFFFFFAVLTRNHTRKVMKRKKTMNKIGFTYFSIDERLNDDNLSSMMNFLDFTGQWMSNVWIEPNQISLRPFHYRFYLAFNQRAYCALSDRWLKLDGLESLIEVKSLSSHDGASLKPAGNQIRKKLMKMKYTSVSARAFIRMCKMS